MNLLSYVSKFLCKQLQLCFEETSASNYKLDNQVKYDRNSLYGKNERIFVEEVVEEIIYDSKSGYDNTLFFNKGPKYFEADYRFHSLLSSDLLCFWKGGTQNYFVETIMCNDIKIEI